MPTIAETDKHYRRNLLIVFAIYVSIFVNSLVLIKQPFEIYIGYLIFALLLPGFISKYGFNRNLAFIFITLFLVGIINILTGDNTPALFFKVFVGLLLSYFFYYYVIVEFDFNIEQLFKWYLKGAYIVSVIGLIQFISFQAGFRWGYDYGWLLNKWGVVVGGNFGIRVNSIFGEPTYLGAVISSAFFVSLYNLTRKDNYYLTKFQSIVIIVVYILSFSGLGQTGIILSVLFLAVNFGLIRYIFIFIPVGVFLFNVMYNEIPDFRNRFDSLYDLFVREKAFELGKTHGSSYILFNNYKVATQNFKSNFLFGTGIGSHPVAFKKYSQAKDIKVYGFNLNSADANSMLLRLISETGLFGVLIFLFIMIKGYVKRHPEIDSPHWLISNAILIMILLNLFRQGHYFLNGFPFFVILYWFNKVGYQQFIANLTAAPAHGQQLTPRD